jgi:O-antigen/teichoic acid export membrane protein
VRNLILARMLGLNDMGVAALLALVVYLLDMISDLNLGTLLIQADDGDDPRMLSTAHSMMLLRSLGSALILLASAWPASQLFGVPEARWAFATLALVPLLRGLNHLDLSRQQRHLAFRRVVVVEVVTQAVLTALAWPLAFWLQSYAAMLWLLVLQSALVAIGSHLAAARPFALGWDRERASRMFLFGWPLLINGFLMFVIFQGDRFVIGAAQRLFPGSQYTLDDLGLYSVAFGIAMMPVAAIVKVGSSLLLPLLSRVQNEHAAFRRRYAMCVQLACAASALLSAALLLIGDRLLIALYGHKYEPATQFFGLLVIMQSIRLIRTAPTLGALAVGDSRTGMYANLVRTCALVGVCTAAAMKLGLEWIAAAGIAGELLALGCTLVRFTRRSHLQYATTLVPVLTTLGVIAASFVVGRAMPVDSYYAIVVFALMTAAAGGAVLAASPRLFHEVREMASKAVHARVARA